VIRTRGNPFRSRPSPSLTATTLAIVALGILIPFLPFAARLGFTPLPPIYFAFLSVATVTYLMMVEVAKRLLMRRTLKERAALRIRGSASGDLRSPS